MRNRILVSRLFIEQSYCSAHTFPSSTDTAEEIASNTGEVDESEPIEAKVEQVDEQDERYAEDQGDTSNVDMSIDGIVPETSQEQESTLVQSPTEESVSEQTLPAPATIATGKHARPEDDSATEDSTNEEEKVRKERETKAKKVKVEKSNEEAEPIEVDKVEDESKPIDNPEQSAKLSEPPTSPVSLTAKPTLASLTHPLPSKPVTVPTGPKAPRVSAIKASSPPPPPPPPPPSTRENSRLRIYFSSPIAPSTNSTSSHTQASSSRRDAPRDSRNPSRADEKRKSPGPAPSTDGTRSETKEVSQQAGDSTASQQEDGDEDVDGEDVDGEDVDGEEVDGEELDLEKSEVVEPTEENEKEECASDETERQQKIRQEKEQKDDEGSSQDDEVANTLLPRKDEDEPREPPSSDSTNVHQQSTAPPVPLPPPEPAADRISISYARNTRRMVIDAEVVEEVRICRAEGKIEVVVNCEAPLVIAGDEQVEDDYRICRGILVSSLRSFALILYSADYPSLVIL